MAIVDFKARGAVTAAGSAGAVITLPDPVGWRFECSPTIELSSVTGEQYAGTNHLKAQSDPGGINAGSYWDTTNDERRHLENVSYYTGNYSTSTDWHQRRFEIGKTGREYTPVTLAEYGDTVDTYTMQAGIGIYSNASEVIEPDYRVNVIGFNSSATERDFLFWDSVDDADSGGKYLAVTSNRSYGSPLLFGTDSDHIYYYYCIDNSNYGLLKYDITADSITSISTTISGRGRALALRLSDTSDIFHLYVIGDTSTSIYKLDASDDSFAEHSSSPFTYTTKDTNSTEIPYTPNRYMTVGSTKYLYFATFYNANIMEFKYTTNADSITLTHSTIGNTDITHKRPGSTDTSATLGGCMTSNMDYKKVGTDESAYFIVYDWFTDYSNNYEQLYMNFTPVGRSGGLVWSGWIYCGEIPVSYAIDTLAAFVQMHGRHMPTEADTWVMFSFTDVSGGYGYYLMNVMSHWSVPPPQWLDFEANGAITAYTQAQMSLLLSMTAHGDISPAGNARMGLLMSFAGYGDITVDGYTAIKLKTWRAFNQAWSSGGSRIVEHQEYISGTDGYNHNLAAVNAARAAEVPALPPYKTLLSPTAPTMSDEFVQQILHQNIKHDTVYDHYDPSFDYGYQDATQRLVLMQPDGVVSFAENLINHPAYEDPKYVNNDTSPYTAEQLSQDSFDGWWSSTTGHKENMLWDYGTDDVYFGYANEWSTGLSITFGYNAAWAGQQFYNFTVPPPTIGLNEMERTWTNEYQIEGAQIMPFYGQYGIAAWADARVAVGIPYSIKVSAQISFPYWTRAAVQIGFPSHYAVAGQVGLPYTSLEAIATQHGFLYDLKPASAAVQIAFKYSTHITTTVSLQYGDTLQSVAKLEMPYSIRTHAVKQTAFPYESVSPIAAQHNFNYSLLVNNPVVSATTFWYTIMNTAIVPSIEDVTVIVDGLAIPVISANVSINEGDFLWKATVVLAELGEYNKFVQDYPFTVIIGTDQYEMVVDEKSINRRGPTNANVQMEVVGLSPAVKFKEPRAKLIDYEVLTPILAKDAVEAILGEPVQWNVINWTIPAYRLTASEISPSKLVTQIVEVVGGVAESLKNGMVQIRYKWEINTNEYHLTTANQIYTDSTDNLSATEQTSPYELYNKFRIREGSDVFSDRIEFFDNDELDDNTLAGILRVYPDPWRLTVKVIQTNGPSITLNAKGVVQRQETQLIEFKEGIASVTYPIVSIDTVDWRSYTLGALVNDPHGREITAPTTVHYGYGLAEVTYTTESIEYETSAPPATDAQFLVEDTP